MTTFGTVAYDLGLVTLKQVHHALFLQNQSNQEGEDRRRLGEILVVLGYLTTEQVTSVLERQQYLQLPLEARMRQAAQRAS